MFNSVRIRCLSGLLILLLAGNVQSVCATQSPGHTVITDTWLDSNGPIAYEPLEGYPWTCWNNASLGTTCPPVRITPYPLPYCPCQGYQLNPNYYPHKYEVVYPTADVGVQNEMNFKTAQGQWATNGTILYKDTLAYCYNAQGQLVTTCLIKQDYVNDYDCVSCPE